MHRGWLQWKWAVLGLALGACASGETRVKAPVPPTGPIVVQGDAVPAGTRLRIRLDQPITKDTKAGQTFTAHVEEAVLDPVGEPIVPGDATVIGKVTDVKTGTHDHPAEVSLVVDRLLVRGVEHPIEARVIGRDVADHTKHTVKGTYVGAGAGGGALIGAIADGWRGAAIGGLGGAAVGALISWATTGGTTYASIPEGTALVVQLDRSIPVAALRGPRPAAR